MPTVRKPPAAARLLPIWKQTPLALPSLLNSSHGGWLETSAMIVNTSDGPQLFVFGSGSGLRAKLRDLGRPTVSVDETGLPPAAASDTGHWGNDQLNAQLGNGDGLLAWNGVSQAPDANLASSASWWNVWPTWDQKAPSQYQTATDANPPRDGVRPSTLMWRYSRSSGLWSPTGAVDAAYAGGVDPNNNFIGDYCAQGVPWVAGFDRPELIADPWGSTGTGQRLYLTTTCSRGIQKSTGATDFSDFYKQLFVSQDSGATWKAAPFRLPGSVTPMAVTSSGRLFLGQYAQTSNGSPAPVVYWSDDHGRSLSPDTPFDAPIDATYKGAIVAYPAIAVGCADTGLGAPFIYPLTIGAVGPDAVLVAYPSTEPASVGGVSITRQVLAVTLVIKPKDKSAIVIPVAIIRAKAPDGSIVMSGLITDGRAVGNPKNLLYWLETTSRPADADRCVKPVEVQARYALFAGLGEFPAPAEDLSAPFMRTAQAPSPTPADPKDVYWAFGDYMKGAVWYDASQGALDFVPVWSEEIAGVTKPYARIVSVAEPIAKAAPGLSGLEAPIRIQPGVVPALKGRPRPVFEAVRECDTCRRLIDRKIVLPRPSVRRAPPPKPRPPIIRPSPALAEPEPKPHAR